MRDMKTFSQWISVHGLQWAKDQEQIVKSTAIDQTEAESMIRDFYDSGYLIDKE